jgi:hypothetical protein
MKCIRSFLSLVFLAMGGCAPQYAILHITSSPPLADVWSGNDGQYLGKTPTDVRYTSSFEENPKRTQIIFFQTDCSQPDLSTSSCVSRSFVRS